MAWAEGDFFQRLRGNGVAPGDDDELRLKKRLLMLATGLASLATVIWLALYAVMGLPLSSIPALVFQVLLLINVVLFLQTGHFSRFRFGQLSLFLLVPFIAQWNLGGFVAASGIALWGVLAPVGALLCQGVRRSLVWFLAFGSLLAASASYEYGRVGAIAALPVIIPPRTSILFFALNFFALSAIVYLLLRFTLRERQSTRKRLLEAHELLQQERDRAERLLENILPGPVADRLKQGAQTIADGHADVAVLFADIVNFTQVAEELAPNQVFAMLNRIFSGFDELAEEHGIERIKTIGDAYMAAGGLHRNHSAADDGESDYCADLANLALAMQTLLVQDTELNNRHLQMRIGICTGPVVAGVVGKKKFIYDLWGDTVNIASRITSGCPSGMIQVDDTTWRRLRDRYDFGEPETIIAKGKGRLTIHTLLGKKSERRAVVMPIPIRARQPNA